MCGICGIVVPRSSSRRFDAGVLERMRDSMAHRGPDAAGAWLDDGVALVEPDDGLGIAVRAVPHAGALELRHQRRVVEHLAVVDDLQVAVIAGHRLLAVREVHDAQAAMAKGNAVIEEASGSIGPAMRHGIAHPRQQVGVEPAARPARYDDAANPAHLLARSGSGGGE